MATGHSEIMSVSVRPTTVTSAPSRCAVLVALGGIVSGLLTPLAQMLTDRLHLVRMVGGLSLVLQGVPFTVLVIVLARVIARAEWWRALVLGLVALVGFDLAMTVAANVGFALTGRPEVVGNVVGGLAGGLVGSGTLAFAAWLLRIGGRSAARWLLVLVVGALLGLLLALDGYLHSETVWILFPIWQAGVALALLHAIKDRQAA
jgi:hypothetical protein